MIDTTVELSVLAVGSLVASAFASVFGIGAGIIIVLVLSVWLPAQQIVPILAVCTLVIDFVRSLTYRLNINWTIARRISNRRSFRRGPLAQKCFFDVPESILGIAIASIMLVTLWAPLKGFEVQHASILLRLLA